jgi:hypothetical protein
MNNKKAKMDKPLTRRRTLEIETLRCENELLKKLQVNSSRRENHKAQAIMN